MKNIVFCTTCKNRTDHLSRTLPYNLVNNPNSKFVVLNYNDRDGLLDYIRTYHANEIGNRRLVVYSYRDAATFRMAHAKNMAHRLGILESGHVLVNLDADNLTGEGFEDFIDQNIDENTFLWANMIKGEMPRGISGRIAVTKKAFLKAGGYNEKFEGWASDDKDFNLRLRMLGYEGKEIDPVYLDGIRHNNKIRFKEYPHVANMTDEYFEVNKHEIKSAVANMGAFGCGVVFKNFDSTPIHLTGLPTRIFGIGMHKTATTSLHRAFEILGYDSWHWSSAHAAKAIWREMNERGSSPTVERYQALCDLPIPLLYKQLDKAYPGSKFILTIRDECFWLKATRKHFDTRFNKFRAGWSDDPFTHRVHTLLYGRPNFDTDTMLNRYRSHNAEVFDYFRHRPNDLLVMHMDHGDGWPSICSFLGVSVPNEPYPHLGASK